MNSDDVKKTSEIIDKLIEYQGEGESKLDEEVCSYWGSVHILVQMYAHIIYV